MRRFEPWFPGLRSALTALVGLAVGAAPGCFVTIADPAIDSTGGRATAGAGGGAGLSSGGTASGGIDGGHAATGGSGGSGGRSEAGVCTGCALPHVKTHGCSDGGCAIVECEPGYVDCDGQPGTGCETDFNVETGDAQAGALATEFAAGRSPTLDGDMTEWSGIHHLYPMNLPCSLCRPDQPGGQNGEPIEGDPWNDADLRAAFRLGWDGSALYVFAQVHDDQIVAWDANDLERQDGIELLVNGDLTNDAGNQYGPDVHHLFVGALAPPGTPNVKERNQSLQPTDTKAATKREAKCYFVEMSLSWFYVMGRQTHLPQSGEAHGFTIATNDWDRPSGVEAGARPVRQSQLFWVVPGVNYAYETTGFGLVTLE